MQWKISPVSSITGESCSAQPPSSIAPFGSMSDVVSREATKNPTISSEPLCLPWKNPCYDGKEKRMPAYIIVDVTVNEPEEYATYRQLTPASIAAYGGKFVVRGGVAETLEGDWQPGRMVVLEFE